MNARMAKNLLWAGVLVLLLAVGAYGLSGALQGIDLRGVGVPGMAPSASPALTAGAASPSPTSAPSPSPTSAPAATERFDSAASDTANLAVFKRALGAVAAATPPSGVEAKTLADALVGAGFDASGIQRSADRTSANLQVPTITVAVRLHSSCLIGQYVRSDASISAEVTAPISTGSCLIGRQPEE